MGHRKSQWARHFSVEISSTLAKNSLIVRQGFVNSSHKTQHSEDEEEEEEDPPSVHHSSSVRSSRSFILRVIFWVDNNRNDIKPDQMLGNPLLASSTETLAINHWPGNGDLGPYIHSHSICSPSKSWATAKDWIRHKITPNAIRKFRAEAKEEQLDRRLAMLIMMPKHWHTLLTCLSAAATPFSLSGGYYQRLSLALFHTLAFFLLLLYISNDSQYNCCWIFCCSALTVCLSPEIHFPPLRTRD